MEKGTAKHYVNQDINSVLPPNSISLPSVGVVCSLTFIHTKSDAAKPGDYTEMLSVQCDTGNGLTVGINPVSCGSPLLDGHSEIHRKSNGLELSKKDSSALIVITCGDKEEKQDNIDIDKNTGGK